MDTVQENLIEKINSYKTLQTELKQLGEQIDKEARKLLEELQKVDDWECMIKECRGHYSKYPKDFFEWCSVTHREDAVQFVKGYSNGDEYEVLEIGLYDPLATQVCNRKNKLCEDATKEQEKIKKKELKELERLKRKYEL